MRIVRERAWWFLVALAALIVIFGIGDVVGGASVDPGIALGLTGQTLSELEAQGREAYRMFDFTTRTQGWNLTMVGGLLLAVLLIPYRSGQRWAWWTLWVLPVWSFGVAAIYLAYGLAPDQPPPPPLVSGPILGTIAAVVLLFDRRRFFADRDPSTTGQQEATAWTGG
jgi:hypothetical protein